MKKLEKKQTVNVKELKEVLRIVRPGLGDGNSIEQSNSFAFVNNKVVTYNDQICITHPVINLNLTGAVNADNLYKLLDRLDVKEVSMTIEGPQVLIKAGSRKAGLQIQEDIKLPLGAVEEVSILDTKNTKWKKLPIDFLSALDFALPVCSTDFSQLILTCINVGNEIVSTDGFRILRQSLSSELPVKGFLLPGSVVKTLVAISPNEIYKTDKWVYFRKDTGAIIGCRIVEGTFPEINTHFITKGTKIVFPKQTLDVIETARIFSDAKFEYQEMVEVHILNGVAEISSRSETGWYKEKVKVDCKKGELEFQITPILFRHILKQTQKCLWGQNKIQFRGDNWKHVIALRSNN